MTAFKATYSDIKLVKTRKVVQFVFEVPVEAADNAMRLLGGMPRPDQEQWVGIAPITEEAATRAPTPADKPKRRMADLSRAQQAGILCSEPQFTNFLARYHEMKVRPEQTIAEAAAEFVRSYCKVTSRAFLDSEPDRGEVWDQLRTEFDAWTGKIGWPDEQASAE